ncbi:hypothetical protein ACM66B_003698 [Microbotryomycetes sp. NB124-2]
MTLTSFAARRDPNTPFSRLTAASSVSLYVSSWSRSRFSTPISLRFGSASAVSVLVGTYGENEARFGGNVRRYAST